MIMEFALIGLELALAHARYIDRPTAIFFGTAHGRLLQAILVVGAWAAYDI
jgi:hypothetical protein